MERVWRPLAGSRVEFSLEMRHASRAESLKEFCGRFGLKGRPEGLRRLPLADKRWPALLDAVESGGAVSLGAAWVVEPGPKASDPDAWYLLSTGAAEFEASGREPKAEIASTVSWEEDARTFASERFLGVVRAARLTGLASMPAATVGLRWERSWFEVWAERAIGRGLDHPMAEPERVTRELLRNKGLFSARSGEPVAWWKAIRPEVTIGDPVAARLNEMAISQSFRVEGAHRLLRESLPPTDFAYRFDPAWNWTGGAIRKGEQVAAVARGLCCNARARAALIEAGVMKGSWFTPMWAVQEADLWPWEVPLDRAMSEPMPGPRFSAAEAEAERARRPSAGARPRGNPERWTSAKAAEVLRAAARAKGWIACGEAPEFSKIAAGALWKKLPAAWREVAPLLPLKWTPKDGPCEGLACRVAKVRWNDWLDEDPDRDKDEAPSRKDLIVAEFEHGDWIAIREGQERVVLWDHETLTAAMEWDDAAEFAGWVAESAG